MKALEFKLRVKVNDSTQYILEVCTKAFTTTLQQSFTDAGDTGAAKKYG